MQLSFVTAVLGYLLGSVPTGMIIVKVFKGVDIRKQGSGHTGGLNVLRAAGLWAGIATGVVDALLGVGAVFLAHALTDDPWAGTAAGVMAVVGHNWSIFIGWGGGIGLSSLAGALACLNPLAIAWTLVIAAAIWFVLVGLLRVHRVRSTIVVMVLMGPLLWVLGVEWPGVWLGVLGAGAVIIKSLPDWNRSYSGL